MKDCLLLKSWALEECLFDEKTGQKIVLPLQI